MRSIRRTIPLADNFSFSRTVRSHGWYDLLPFLYDETDGSLSRVFLIEGRLPVAATLCRADRAIDVTLSSRTQLTSKQTGAVIQQIRSCFRMDEDLGEFYADARKRSGLRWIPRSGAGRMLRAPYVFEDVVKMICTTNCSWSLTTSMVRNLVEKFGIAFSPGQYAFPNPEAIAGSTEQLLRKEVRLGYRSPYILDLATQAASGRIGIEHWRMSTLPTVELFDEIRQVKGVGPYAAGNLLKLVGRYDYLGLDSWVRARFYNIHKKGRKVSDATIERHYAGYGKWRGLYFWLEMTRDWHDDKFTKPA